MMRSLRIWHVTSGGGNGSRSAPIKNGAGVRAFNVGECMYRSVRCLAALALGFAPVAANATTIAGGTTAVRVTADLAGLGLTPGLTGSATVDSSLGFDRIFFPVTGGDLDFSTLAGQIRHDGSGITLTSGATVVGLGNFVIDTAASQLLADVTLNGSAFASAAPIISFSLAGLTAGQVTDLANPAISLRFTQTGASALTAAFGAPDLTDAEFGLAATAPVAVPEPATWAMMILGFGAVGLATRRRLRPDRMTLRA